MARSGAHRNSVPAALLPGHQVVVVGAGAAGLGVAGALKRWGVEALVLEREDVVGSSWRRRYDGLRLNTVRGMSGQPGLAIPRWAGRWPRRDAFVAYLERYAEHHALDVHTGVAVERIEAADGGWRLIAAGREITTRFAVVATGHDGTPMVPAWPGRDGFTGRLIHSAEYRNPAPFRGQRVLVVGAGNTGTEVAAELAGSAATTVTLSMRTPANFVQREILDVPITPFARLADLSPAPVVDLVGAVAQRRIFGDLSRFGLPPAPLGIGTEIRVKGLGPTVDSGFVSAVKEGRIGLAGAVERFEGPEVVLAGGARIEADSVIAATGYARGLEDLVGHLGVLDPSGMPGAVEGKPPSGAPGLYFNGYLLPLGGQLPTMARTSRRIARHIAAVRRRR